MPEVDVKAGTVTVTPPLGLFEETPDEPDDSTEAGESDESTERAESDEPAGSDDDESEADAQERAE